MSILQFRFAGYRFRPTWLGTLVTLCCIPLFIKLGLWQYGKAEQKQALQDSYERYAKAPPSNLPDVVESPEAWRYRPVELQGEYLTQYQILLDNQVEGEVAGYHVITPVLIDGTKRIVLVDRGWIPASDNHADLPQVKTPPGKQFLIGKIWVPTTKFYTLEVNSTAGKQMEWQTVLQNLDMARYRASVPYDLMPVVVRLDEASNAGGFIRNWVMPDDRITTNIGYAYQWFGFAVAALLIYLYVSLKKIKQEA